MQVVFGDINPSVGAETEREFVEKYGKGNVKFIAFDVTDGAKFEGKSVKKKTNANLN